MDLSALLVGAVGVGGKCAGEWCFSRRYWYTGWKSAAWCFMWTLTVLVQLNTVLGDPVKYIGIWPSPVGLLPWTSRNTISRYSRRPSGVSVHSDYVTSWLPTMANGIVMFLFLWLNSADLIVLSNSVFFFNFRNSYRTFGINMCRSRHFSRKWEKKRCTPLYREVGPK